jgi:MFS transporter, DHA2 family, multidrug resistance protein
MQVNKWLIALIVIIPTFIEVVDTSVVNVALDHIRGSLSAGVDEATWAITSYLVSNAIIIPLSSWLSRLFGRKRYFIFSVSLFTLSSLFCGLAWSLPALIFFRVLQGIGGGALQPLSQTILLETFPPKEHGMAMAVFGIGVVFAPILGPILGGWITDNWSWHWIFFINIPIGIISVMLLAAFLKDPPFLKRASTARIDYWGIILITFGLGCLQVVLDKGQQEDWFNSPFILTLAAISAICLIAFVILELVIDDPVLHLRVFKNRSFAAGNVIMFMTFFTLFGTIVLLPIFLQKLMGYTSYWAGLAIAPGGVATIFAMPLVGKLVSKVSPKGVLLFGLVAVAYSTWFLTGLSADVDFAFVAWSRIAMGFGLAFIFVSLTNLTLSGIPKEEMGNASGIYNLLRNLGGSFGVAFVTTVLARRAQFHQARLAESATPFDPNFQHALAQVSHLPQLQGAPSQSALGVLYQKLMIQASLFSFVDAFQLCTMILICIMPLVLFLRRPAHMKEPIAAH